MVKSNVTNGKPYTWRHVSTVWGRVLGNRPPQGGYGAGCLAHTTKKVHRALRHTFFLMFSVYNVDNQTFNNRFQFLLSAIFPISLVSRISDDGFCLFIDFQIEFCQCCCRSYNLYSISLVRKVPDSIVQIHHTVAVGFLLT